MEIYENFPINEFVDVIIHNSNDWGFHEESLYAVDLDTLKFKIRSQFPNTSHFCVRIQRPNYQSISMNTYKFHWTWQGWNRVSKLK